MLSSTPTAEERFILQHPGRETAAIDWREPAFREGLRVLLSEIMHGEILSMETSAGMMAFAPSLPARFFLAEQAADERRHALAFRRRLQQLHMKPLPAGEAMQELSGRFRRFVERRSWIECLVAQNIVLEGVATVLFEALGRVADSGTARMLAGIEPEEQKHVRFGITSLRKRVSEAGCRRAILETEESLLPVMARVITSQRRMEEDHGVDYRALGQAALSRLAADLSAIGVELSMWERAKRSVWSWLR